MGPKIQLMSYDSASDSDDPLDVIERVSPSRSASRPTPNRSSGSSSARPPPLSARRGGSGTTQYIRRDDSDDSTGDPRVVHSSATKRRRIVSDSEDEVEDRSASKEHTGSLARFVAGPTSEHAEPESPGSAVASHVYSSKLEANSGDLGTCSSSSQPSASRKAARRVVSDSDDEDPGGSESLERGEQEDAFGIIASIQNRSNPDNHRILPDPEPENAPETADEPGLPHDQVEAVDHVGFGEETELDGAEQGDVVHDNQPSGKGVATPSEPDNEVQAKPGANISAEIHGTMERSTNTPAKGDVQGATTISETLATATELPSPARHLGDIDTSSTVAMGAIPPEERSLSSQKKQEVTEPATLSADAEVPKAGAGPADLPSAADIVVSEVDEEPGESAVGPPQETGIGREDQTMDVDGPAPPLSEAISNQHTLEVPARPKLPQTPSDVPLSSATYASVPAVAGLPDGVEVSETGSFTHSVETPPDIQNAPASSNALMHSAHAAEQGIDGERRTMDTADPGMEEEGEEEIDLDEAEEPAEIEIETGPDITAKTENGAPSPLEAVSHVAPAATPSSGFETPAPVVLNSKGKPKQKPGPKAGWKQVNGGGTAKPVVEDKKAGKGSHTLKKGKVEALKSAARGRSTSISEIPGPAPELSDRSTPAAEAEEDGTDDDQIYCSCGKPSRADGNDTLIGCDGGCDMWFHAGCVRFTEDEVGLIDSFICAYCEKATGQRTTMKRVCKRDGCDKQFTAQQSKFCSSACAFRNSHAIVAAMQNKKQLKQLASALAKYPSPPPDIRVIEHYGLQPISTRSSAAADQVEMLEQRISGTQASISILEKRLAILGRAIEQCDALRPANPANGVSGADESGKNKKRKGGGGDDRPCGWVECLIWGDTEVAVWQVDMPLRTSRPDGRAQGGQEEDVEMRDEATEEEEGGYCTMPRKRCDRHSGWQKTINYSLDFEVHRLRESLGSMQAERDGLVMGEESRRAGKIARDNLHEMLALRLAKHVL